MVVTLPQLVIDSLQLQWSFTVGGHAVTIPGVVVMLPYIAGFIAYFVLIVRVRYKAPLYLNIAATLCGLATLAKGLAGLGLPVLVFLAYLGVHLELEAPQPRAARVRDRDRVRHLRGGRDPVAPRDADPPRPPVLGRALRRQPLAPAGRRAARRSRHLRVLRARARLRGAALDRARAGRAGRGGVAAGEARAATAAGENGGAARRAAEVRRQGIFWFGAIWFVAGYALVSLSVTKFHHYILPAIPGLAIAIGCFLDDILTRRDGRAAAAAAMVGHPAAGAGARRSRGRAQERAALHLAVLVRLHQHARRAALAARRSTSGAALIGFGVVFALATIAIGWRRIQRWAAVGLCLAAVAFTYFLLDDYMRRATPYWTQKGLIATYYKMRRSPDEKLLVWQMYWRGENFYTQNEIYEGPKDERTIFLGDRNFENLKAWMEKHRGRRAFFLVEQSRYSTLETAVPADARKTLKIVDNSNMKFCLASADL